MKPRRLYPLVITLAAAWWLAISPLPHTRSVAPESPQHLPETAGEAGISSGSEALQPTFPGNENASLAEAVQLARHAVEQVGALHANLPINHGARYFAANPGQDLTVRFLDGAVRIGSGKIGKNWSAELRLKSAAGSEPPPKAEDSRVEYVHADGVTEWYVNRSEGIEHGFTLDRRLADSGEIRMEMEIRGLEVAAGDGGNLLLRSRESGEVRLSYEKLRVIDATGASLSARMEPTRDGLAIVVNDTFARYPVTIDPLIISQEGRLGPDAVDGAQAEEWFGQAVAIEGDTALVGSPGDDHLYGNSVGSAYIFTRSGSSWSLQAKITASDADADGVDFFGASVALSGSTALIGAFADSSYRGSAYVFTQTENGWVQQAKLTPPGETANQHFGERLALSGNIALVPAAFDDEQRGCVYVFARSGNTWTPQAKLVASNGTPEDYFGQSVAISGQTAVIGAYFADAPGAAFAGCAYVFTISGANWFQQAKLSADDAIASDRFGESVAISGNTVLVGASTDDPGGSAYAFVRSGTTWTQQAKLVAADRLNNDRFGISIACEGDTAIVGAWGDDTTAGVEAGSAYVFTRSGTTWTQLTKLAASDAAAGDNFGYSVALSGDSILVGSFNDDTLAGEDAGSAHVFVRSGASWSPQVMLTAGTNEASDFFGQAVDLFEDTAVVGAPGDDTQIGNNVGSAYVFVRDESNWTFQARLFSDDGAANDTFGWSVAASEDSILVGAYGHDAGGSNTGAAYIFARDGNVWTPQAKLTAADAAATDLFGYAVALDGGTALVGAYSDNTPGGTNAGSAYVFTRNGIIWSQQAQLIASDSAANDNFASSVALDGDTAVLGALADDTGAGSDAGSAYVFTRAGTSWSQQSKLTAADGAASDYFGYSVAISGNTALLGANSDDDLGAQSGSAYVFTRTGITWSQQAKLFASDGAASDFFGVSVALSGNTALVGASADDTMAGTDVGSAYLFIRSGTSWAQDGKITAGDAEPGDNFGWALALSGDTAMVGARSDDSVNPFAGALADTGSVYLFRIEGSQVEIDIEQPAGFPLSSGQSNVGFVAVAGDPGHILQFVIRNHGAIDTLTGIAAGISGPNAADFSIISPPPASVPAGGSALFQIRFSPLSVGNRQATLSIASNDVNENPFVIALSGVSISPTADSDGDGLNDASEHRMAALGFNWQVAQTDLVDTYFDHANGAGLYTESQIRALSPGTPVIARDLEDGSFTLTLDWKRSTDLSTFIDFPASPDRVSVNADGDIEFNFTSPDNAAFFRLEVE